MSIGVVICVLSYVQDNRKPADVTQSTKLRSTIAVYKQAKVHCMLSVVSNYISCDIASHVQYFSV